MTMTTDLKVACYDDFAAKQWALNSAVECHPHTVEVVGSNPTAPTILSMTYRGCGFPRGCDYRKPCLHADTLCCGN
jgi:hypothetical protein